MLYVLRNSWALLLGMFLLMVGNGLQSSLLGVRGAEAGFSSWTISMVMSAYFAGFLVASRVVPLMIRRVGHVRVFAALGSLVSAVLLLFPALQEPAAWIFGRAVIGFCFCGVYVTAESWLNNSSNNETRGQTLSAYMIVQMAGVIAAQSLLVVPDVSGFLLFVIPSVLVSISFAPILLSVAPTPAFEATKPMTLRELFAVSPLGCTGMFLLGGVFAAQFGMSAVYATQAGLTLGQTSLFIATIYIGALVMQYPLGWLSDRADRRKLICAVAFLGGISAVAAIFFGGNYNLLLVTAFLIGGSSNPLYSLLLAYTNDFLEPEDMASASGGLLFINGIGAIAGPLVIGWALTNFGPPGYFILVAVLLLSLAGYALYRMTQRSARSVSDNNAYAPLTQSSTAVTVAAAQEYWLDSAEDEEPT